MNQFSITHSFVYTFRILLGIIFFLALYIIRILLLLYLGRFLISFFFKYFFIRYISYYRIYLMIVCWVFSIERMWRKTKELSGFFPVFIVPWSWDVPVMAVSWLRLSASSFFLSPSARNNGSARFLPSVTRHYCRTICKTIFRDNLQLEFIVTIFKKIVKPREVIVWTTKKKKKKKERKKLYHHPFYFLLQVK